MKILFNSIPKDASMRSLRILSLNERTSKEMELDRATTPRKYFTLNIILLSF
jgi:hypothetical protein